MTWLDTIWNLPALPSLLLWGAPVEGAILWLISRVRKTVTKSSKLMDVAPDLTEEEKEALAWSARKLVRGELALYLKAKERGEL